MSSPASESQPILDAELLITHNSSTMASVLRVAHAAYSRTTWMIVMQLANHATHHFGQVVTLLRQLGYTPQQFELTDLIAYYLWRFPQPNQKERIKSFLGTFA